jgi:hypothetical protein
MYFKDLAMDINRNNYETSFLLYLDRELNPAEMLEVEKFLTENTDLQKEFELLQHTVFLPEEEEIVYDHKELLFHKEEKRKVVPLFWIRVAASVLILITAGWFILMKISNDHKREIAGRNKSQITNVPAGIGKDSVNHELGVKNNTDQEIANEIKIKQDETVPGSVNGIAKSNHSNQSGEKGKTEKKNPAEMTRQDMAVNQTGNGSLKTDPDPDESVAAMQKSNAATNMQPERVPAGNNPEQVSALPGAQVPALVLATSVSKNLPTSEQSGSKDQDLQNDNAISVVALNDQNKSITEFFKKLTRRAPDNDQSNNARKVNVSVFQLSY